MKLVNWHGSLHRMGDFTNKCQGSAPEDLLTSAGWPAATVITRLPNIFLTHKRREKGKRRGTFLEGKGCMQAGPMAFERIEIATPTGASGIVKALSEPTPP